MTDQDRRVESESEPKNDAPPAESALSLLSTKEVKKLHNRSRSLRALSFFWLLAAALCVVFTATAAPQTVGSIIYPVYAGLAVLAAIGSFLFKTWSRLLSMALCVLLLIAFPIGTIFGVLGLIALWGSKPLFGSNRISQDQLRAELKLRESNNVA